jgi:plastocyanin
MRKSVLASAALAIALTGAGATAAVVTADAAPQHNVAQSQQITGAKKLTISAFTFTPGKLKVTVGQKIKIVNMDAVAHTVTADDGVSFDVAVPAKTTVTFKAPSTPGKYKFHCTIHPTMKGLLIVK